MSKLKNKNILITGGASGLGLSIAKFFSKEGANVYIFDNDISNKTKIEDELSLNEGIAKIIHCDLNKHEKIENLINDLWLEAGQIDILINNVKAGSSTKSFWEETLENWNLVLDVGLTSNFLISRSLIKKCKQNQASARIINIGSILSDLVSTKQSPSYHVVKSALVQLTKYLAVHGGEFGVITNCLSIGFLVQDRHYEKFLSVKNKNYKNKAEKHMPIKQVVTEKDVLNVIKYLSSEAPNSINGSCLTIDGGAIRQEQFDIITKLEN